MRQPGANKYITMNSKTEIRPVAGEEEMWFAQRLYLDSFPEDERRDTTEWVRLSFTPRPFSNFIILCDAHPAGFITAWDMGSFAYVEHFAVDVARRSSGIGGAALDGFCLRAAGPVVLEVELPTAGATAARRIEFYKRHGFQLCEKRYMQPPYRPGGRSVELKLMWRGDLDMEGGYDDVVRRIHRNVYNAE